MPPQTSRRKDFGDLFIIVGNKRGQLLSFDGNATNPLNAKNMVMPSGSSSTRGYHQNTLDQAAANALLAANMLGGGYSPGGASSQSNVLISPRNHIYQSHSSHSNNSLI